MPFKETLRLCRWSTLLGGAERALAACDAAVQLLPNDGMARESRGLARALNGDLIGALEDFEASKDWLADETWRTMHAQWIARIKRDEMPIRPSEIEALIVEEIGEKTSD